MNKRRILFAILALVLLVGVVLGLAIPSLASSLVVNDPSWIEAPRETPLTKCPGGTQCDHSDGKCDYDYVYSFAVVGDTQNINIIDAGDKKNEYMKDLYQWILDRKNTYNIQYVLGLGDITQAYHSNYNDNKYGLGKNAITEEWKNAAAALALLDGNLGYSLVRGNHDVSSYFNGKFGSGTAYYNTLETLAKEKDDQGRPMAGFFNPDKIEDTYRKLVIGDHKYIIFTLDWFPTSRETDCTDTCASDCAVHDCLGWVDRTLAANSDYTAIITTHDFIYYDSTIVDDYEDTFPYENLTGSRESWEEVSASGGNSTPRDLWKVLRKHENVELILCGHVDVDDINVTQLRGDNGNTVTAMLIDPQTIDSAVEPVGIVAIFYMAADGKVMNVDYVSTVRDLDNKPAYRGAQNQMKVTLDYTVSDTDDGWTETTHGDIPTHIYNAYPFHVLLDDDSDDSTNAHLYGSYNSWNEAHTAIRAFNAAYSNVGFKKAKTFYVVMSQDVTDTHSGDRMYNESRLTLTKVVLDLNDHKLTLAGNSELLRFDTGHTGIFPRYGITNGDIKIAASGAYLVKLTTGAVSSGTLELTDLNITYEVASTKPLITCLEGSGSADVTLNVTNCNIDSSKVTGSVTKLFDLADPKNNNFVNLTIKGGSIKGNTVANTTLFTQHITSDKITLVKDSGGNYTTFTFADSGTFSHVFYTDIVDSNNYPVFYELGTPTASGSVYNYPLVNSKVTLTEYGVIPAKYNSVTDYPFVLFKNNEAILATKDWKTLVDTNFKGTANYQSGCTLLLRRDYSTSEASESPSWFFRIDDLTIDLGGFIFTRGTYHMFQIFGTESTAHETSIVIKNGTLKTIAAFSPIVFNNAGSNTATDKLDLVLNGVTFDIAGATGGSRGPIVAFGDGNKLGIKANITLNDCTIDRGSSTNSATLFSLLDYKDPTKYDVVNNKTDITVTVNGGTLVADSLANLTVASYSPIRDGMTASADKVILGKGSDGKYLTVKLPAGYTAPAASYAFTDGNRALGLVGSDDNYKYYTFDTLGTVYGDVTAQYVSVETYPFALFYNGAFKAGYETFAAAINAAVKLTDTDAECAVCDTVYIAMRRDFVSPSAASVPTLRGKIVVDLQGHKLSSTSAYLVSTYINYGKLLADGATLPDNSYAYAKNYLGFASTLTLQNGSLHNGRSDFGIYGVDTKGEIAVDGFGRKSFVYNFNNIVFTTVSKPIMQTFGSKDGTGHNIEVNLNGCTLDFTGAADGVNMFLVGASENAFTVDLDFKDCKVVASKLDSYLMYNASSDDTVTVSSSNGSSYLTVTQTTAGIPTASFTSADGSTLAFFESSSADGKYVYTLGKAVDTDHGVVPPNMTDIDKCPLILFKGGTAIGAYETFGAALTEVAKDLTGEYVILLRRNFTKEDGKYIANFKGSLTVDLGGNTLTITDTGNYIFDLGAGDSTGATVSFALKNGTVIKAGGRGVACTNYNSALKDKDTTYNFLFEGVTFRSTNSTYNTNVVFATWENGYDGATANLLVNSTFNNCVFDLRDSIDGAIMLNLTHSSGTKDRVVHTVTVKGGEILLDDTADFTSGFAKCDKVTAGRYDTVTFVKDDDGKYTKAKVPAGVTLTATVNDGKLTYVKKSEDTTDATYELIPTAALNISFVPRTSLTLDSNLYLNVYVPVSEYLTSFTLDGKAYDPESLTAQDGYYVFPIELPAKVAAREIALVAHFDVDGEELSASFTLSTVKYAEKLLANTDVTVTEKTLICDALNYIKSAYAYFAKTDAEKATATEVGNAIDTVTNGFTFSEFATVSGTTDLTVPKGVTFILDATPRIRFYFEDGADLTGYTFKIGNDTVPFTADEETIDTVNYECADISLFAYRMIDTIDLYEGTTKLGSFQINSYYEFARTQSNAALVDVVEKFYTYCVSAKEYRNSVLQGGEN